MKSTLTLSLALSLLGGFQPADGDLADFAKQALDLEVSAQSFGKLLSEFPGAEKIETQRANAEANNFDWYQSALTKAYDAKHAERSLYLGFNKDRLVSIRVFIRPARIPLVAVGSEPAAVLRNEALDRIFSEFEKRRQQFPGLPDENRLGVDQNNGEFIADDGKLRMHYNGFCTPMENLFGVIFIVPSHKKP